MSSLKNNKFLILRRIVQFGLLLLFAGGNYFELKLLRGNYSSATLFDRVPLSDPYSVLQMLFSGFVASIDILVGATIVFVLYALIFGRMFCSWICPINIVTDIARYLRKKMRISPTLSFSKKTRYGVLVLGLVLSTILGFSAFEAISPISILHRGIIFGIGSGWAVILAIFLFDFATVKDGWCGHLCPLGAFYTIIGKYSIIKVKHIQEKCTNCMKCFAVCPEEQVLDIIGKSSGIISSSACTNCARCIETCDDKALHFSLVNSIKTKTKTKQS